MEDLAKKKNEDLENVRKKIDELVGYAWERGYKCGQADRKEPVEEEHEFCVGDVVRNNYLGNTGIIVGISNDGKQTVASIYTREFEVPQIVPLIDLTHTGQHVNVLGFFNKAFIDIQEVDKNGNT